MNEVIDFQRQLVSEEDAVLRKPKAIKSEIHGALVNENIESRFHLSELQKQRLKHKVDIPDILKGRLWLIVLGSCGWFRVSDLICVIDQDIAEYKLMYHLFKCSVPHTLVRGEERDCNNKPEILALFPNLSSQDESLSLCHLRETVGHLEKGKSMRVGIVLSGGQAAGGHNVIIGLYRYLKHRHPGSVLIGFKNGPKGILTKDTKVLEAGELNDYRNMGGFHLLGSGRDKIETQKDLSLAAKSCTELDLDGLIVVGGDDSNTNAAVVSEYFQMHHVKTNVVGVPKTLDGDLKSDDVPISFGFDTACKVYSELIGNIMIDALSAKKYWHFIRLMGRAASHVTLECALQTHPQLAFISEEIVAKNISLGQVANLIADCVEQRSKKAKIMESFYFQRVWSSLFMIFLTLYRN